MTRRNVGRHTLIHGEAHEVLRTMPANSFDALVTDPPYSAAIRGGSQKMATSVKYQQTDAKRMHEEFLGDGRDQRSFQLWSMLWITAAYRLVRQGGVACIFSDYRNLAATIDAMQAGGFVYDGCVPWLKKNSRPRLGWFQTSKVEFVVIGRRGDTPKDARKCGPAYVEGMPPSGSNRVHPTQKPIDTLAQLFAFRDDWQDILDPFAGTGTTVLAAESLRRSCTAVEMSQHYFGVMVDRVTEATAADGTEARAAA